MSINRNLIFLTLVCLFLSFPSIAQKGFTFTEDEKQRKIKVLYNGSLLTAYCFFDSTEKPVLYPLKSVSGKIVTRGWPIVPRVGERTDHPHHLGLWFNYESVNGLDFWNNSEAISPERKHLYGSIRHKEVLSVKGNRDTGELKTRSHWVDNVGKVLLVEETSFTFRVKGNTFIIDRVCTLKATVPEVLFRDVKDGLLGMRVARELEMPADRKDLHVEADGSNSKVPLVNNAGVTGMYTSAKGVKGDSVWSTRAEWVSLSGKIGGEAIAVAILDHPKNIGHPTYWHARGYGLFAANPLGKKAFTSGKEELNFKLKENETATFRYRIVIQNGTELSDDQLNGLLKDFSKQ